MAKNKAPVGRPLMIGESPKPAAMDLPAKGNTPMCVTDWEKDAPSVSNMALRGGSAATGGQAPRLPSGNQPLRPPSSMPSVSPGYGIPSAGRGLESSPNPFPGMKGD